MDRISVALIDHQPLILEGFKSLFSRTNGIKLVATVLFTGGGGKLVKNMPHI